MNVDGATMGVYDFTDDVEADTEAGLLAVIHFFILGEPYQRVKDALQIFLGDGRSLIIDRDDDVGSIREREYFQQVTVISSRVTKEHSNSRRASNPLRIRDSLARRTRFISGCDLHCPGILVWV